MLDLIIKGGRVIDPSIGLDGIRDVAIASGRIAAVEPSITNDAVETLEASGKIVTPGLIDIHTHAGRDQGGPALALKDGVTGFIDAGSAGAANGQAVQALLNTFLAAAAGMVGWMAVEKIKGGHATSLGTASGMIAGLATITGPAGYVGGMAGVVFGLVGGAVCYWAVSLKNRFGYDDSLDVVGIHGAGGLTGGLLLGLFADASAIPGGEFSDGLFFGGGVELLFDQIVAMFSVVVLSFVVTWVLAKVLDMTIGLRVDDETEQTGLDQTLHSESAYNESAAGSVVV